MKSFFYPLLLTALLFSFLTSSNAKLLQVLQITRHGARTPNSFEFKPNQYPHKSGELTSLGKIQQYYLGQEMRQRYVHKLALISQEFDPSEVVVKSSGKQRVVESAISFINGLYPQTEGDLIIENIYNHDSLIDKILPHSDKHNIIEELHLKNISINVEWAEKAIKIIPMEKDMFFHADQGKNCPLVNQKLSALKTSEKIKDAEEGYKKGVYQHIVEVINNALDTERLSVDLLDIVSAKRVLDSHRCNSFHNVEYPQFNQTTLKLLEDLRYNLIYQIFYKDHSVKSVAVTKLLEDFHHHIQRKINHNEGPKYVIYSAHDHNIEALLSVLLEENLLEDRKYFMVEFASTLTIEIHSETNQENEENYHLKFFYNDELLPVKWCESNHCSISEFQKIIETFVVSDIHHVCNIHV